MLDGLIARHHLPPINVVFIDSLDHARRGNELPPNPDFADFMAHELLPWLRGRASACSGRKPYWQDPATGNCLFMVALRYPRLFGNVLSLSGSYWWAPEGDTPGWLTRQYQQSPPYPVRFWLQAGKFETAGPGGGIYRTTQDFEQVLRKRLPRQLPPLIQRPRLRGSV